MSCDYYMACSLCRKALHIAQDGLGGFTFYSKQPDTMRLLGKFLEEHVMHGAQVVSEHTIDNEDVRAYQVTDAHGNVLPDD